MTKKEVTNDEVPMVITQSRPPHSLSFVIDGVVQDTLYTQDRFAAILQSEPIIVNSTGVETVPGQTTYNEETGEFTNPDGSVETAVPLPITAS